MTAEDQSIVASLRAGADRCVRRWHAREVLKTSLPGLTSRCASVLAMGYGLVLLAACSPTGNPVPADGETGEAWFGPIVWNDMRVMRISLSNFRTTEKDIQRVVKAVRGVLQAVRPQDITAGMLTQSDKQTPM